jgi:hypothetical protein
VSKEFGGTVGAAKTSFVGSERTRALNRVASLKYSKTENGKARILRYSQAYTKLPKVRIAARESHLRLTYGISVAAYDQLLKDQNGGCTVCGVLATSEIHGVLGVDHNHETGVVRGLLCHSCNVALGHGRDDPRKLRKLAEYLERTE